MHPKESPCRDTWKMPHKAINTTKIEESCDIGGKKILKPYSYKGITSLNRVKG